MAQALEIKKRLAWSLFGGVLVSCLPYVVARVGIDVLLPLFVLEWPGAFVGMAIGGWNAEPLTVFFMLLTNITLYTALIYFTLRKLENWKQAKPSND